MSDKESQSKRKWLAYSSVGIMFPVSIVVGLGIGYYLDKWLKTSPYLAIIFTLYGVAAGFVNLIRTTRENDQRK